MGAPEGFERKEVLYRIGTFFLLVGIGLLVFFFISEAAKQVTFNYLCWSLILIVLGFLLRSQVKRTVTPSGRFSIVRKMMPKAKKDAEKKK